MKHEPEEAIGLADDLGDYPSTPNPTEPDNGICFGAYVIHGSGPNGSDRHRRATTFAFDRQGNEEADGHGQPLRLHRCGAIDPLSR